MRRTYRCLTYVGAGNQRLDATIFTFVSFLVSAVPCSHCRLLQKLSLFSCTIKVHSKNHGKRAKCDDSKWNLNLLENDFQFFILWHWLSLTKNVFIRRTSFGPANKHLLCCCLVLMIENEIFCWQQKKNNFFECQKKLKAFCSWQKKCFDDSIRKKEASAVVSLVNFLIDGLRVKSLWTQKNFSLFVFFFQWT